jgi:hypothetical protein
MKVVCFWFHWFERSEGRFAVLMSEKASYAALCIHNAHASCVTNKLFSWARWRGV